jgi:hypothetical protein
MACITRIEVANFLSDGYVSGKEWIPLYRGETLRLFGQSAALQIDNGGGKTSLTEACLYLLSRNRQLKPRVEDRVAPVDNGWTHIRIEFIEKPHNDNILQSSLITVEPEDVPGTPYVIGLCWNRGKEPHFYQFQGLLEDALCFLKTENKLELIDNDSFRKSVKEIPGSRWDTWRNIAEWHEDIRQFTNVEIIKQNVEFQLEGAGDYSAMVTKVKQQNGESYAVAFFRQFVAPELLRQPLGDEGEEDEQKFEDALFKTLKPTADALVDIAKQQRDLKDATEAIAKFQPIEEKAQEIIDADGEYQDELTKVIRDGAIIHAIAVKYPLPGIPAFLVNRQWIKDNKVLEVLSQIVLDKRHGALITDEGLAAITGAETRRLNERARELKLKVVSTDGQLIDFKADLKILMSKTVLRSGSTDDVQPIENKGDLKKSAGGRRYGISCYDLDSALSLVNAAANFTGARTAGVDDILIRAFGIAITELDTNPYRAEKRRLDGELDQVTKDRVDAKAEHDHWQKRYEELLANTREAEENQIAYETFAARKEAFLKEHWETPLAAKKWAEEARKKTQQALTEHIEKTSKLDGEFRLWKNLKYKHGIISLPSALDDLIETFETVSAQDREAKNSLTDARARREQLSDQFSKKNSSLMKFQEQHQFLSGLAGFLPKFQEIFGDVEPDTLNPQKSLQDENKLLQSKNLKLVEANRHKLDIDELMPNVATFQKIFGEVDPSTLNPVKALMDHNSKIASEQQNMDGHRPYLVALNKYREKNPGQTPDEWLQKVAEVRSDLSNEKRKNTERIGELNGELADLDKYAVADDRVYAKALATLQAAGTSFERLHETVTNAVSGDRRQQLLTLFSAALSAPVVSSIEDAEQATKTLETANLTVPVFFKSALSLFIQQGEIKVSGAIAYNFLVGRHTRQVEILLDPALIEAEKVRIQTNINQLTSRNKDINTDLASVSEESDSVKLAVSAKDAIKRDSENKFKEAEVNLDRMNVELSSFEVRASDDARKSIEAMRQYIKVGGVTIYQELTEVIIPQLVAEIKNIDERIEELNAQVTEEANRALLAAKDYKKHGGDAELNRLAQEIGILDPQVKTLKDQIEDLVRNISEVLEMTEARFTAELNKLKDTYATDKLQLEAAITFEKKGNDVFMQIAPETRKGLENDIGIAQRRLENIDFDRANSYIQMTKVEERSPADQLADAEGKRNQAKTREINAQQKINNLTGQIAVLIPFVEAMHEMILVIRAQNAKIAVFSDDIRQRIHDGAVHPEILRYAEAIRLACLGDSASTSEEARTAIANLKGVVEELEIDTKHLLALSNACKKTRKEFEERRGEFCGKARSGEIKGLHVLEIELIENATTLEQLISIHELKGKIEEQIKEREANLQKIREVMESNKAATVDSLAHFARQAKLNLEILDRVMKRKPDARFIVKADMASEERIRQIIESLIAEIEDRESAARERSCASLNEDIERRNKSYKEMIHSKIYHNIFIDPQVSFIHTAIRDGETPLTPPGTGLSTGQHTALAMMWLVRQAEYAQDRVAMMYGTRKEQRAALKGSQRIMFFDGLFSNLSNESYINAAFHGLKDVGDNFQLIGLIHNPHYVNNKDIFPVHLVGKRKLAKRGDKERVFVAVEPWQEDNGMIMYTSAFKHNSGGGDHAET